MDSEKCTVCDEAIGKEDITRKVHYKGLQTFIDKSKKRNDEKWKIWETLTEDEFTVFHDKCRKRYLGASDVPLSQRKRPKLVEPEETSTTNDDDFEADELFNYAELCVYCDKPLDHKHNQVRLIKCTQDQQALFDWAKSAKDARAKVIASRFKYLLQMECICGYYHAKCRKTYKLVRASSSDETNQVFQEIVDYIETSGQYKFDIKQFRTIMAESEYNMSLTDYSLNKKLEEKFGDNILIFKHVGKSPVYFYKTKTLFENSSEWLANPESLSDFNKRILLDISAEIISHDVKNQQYITNEYPPGKLFLKNVHSDIPKSLKTFLSCLLSKKEETLSIQDNIQRDNIAHSIISILRPKSFVSTLQLAVGTYILRKTGSKLIVNLLSKLGVSATYHNIQLYEASSIENPPEVKKEDTFVQFVYDNADHNVSTLDGHKTFHCLGGIAIYTPHHSISYEGGIKKCLKMPSAQQLAQKETIPIIPFSSVNVKKLENIIFDDMENLLFEHEVKLEPAYLTYLLAKGNEIQDTPLWKGFMEVLSKEQTYSMSHIECLPFVNGPPSDLNTLNSALLYSIKKANECNQETIFVTFDLPLYLKARSIVEQSDNPDFKRIVVRLGGFHLLLSYLGAMGNIMEESGLEDLWSTAYAVESVKKLMSGHAFSKSVRAHILTFTAIGIIILKRINGVCDELKKYVDSLIGGWKEEEIISTGDCNCNILIQSTTTKFIEEMENLGEKGDTPKLWIQFLKMELIMIQFIESERLGNWKLHLQSMCQMLPILHAGGHFAYAKALQVFLQDMEKLQHIMNEEEYHRYTEEGYFTIRRSDKAFAGIWSDMTIEQTLNRFFGTDLKHGRGVTESVVARYLLGMPCAFQVMQSLEEYVGLSTENSEQHVDTTSSRMSRDNADLKKFMFWLEEHDLFKERRGLTSLSTGIVGGELINCHMAFEKGREGMKSMLGRNMTNVTLSAVKSKVKTFASARKGIQINSEHHAVDTNLLFQRISILFSGNEQLTREALGYELAPYPLSLFDTDGFMRKSAKSELFKVFKSNSQSNLQLKDYFNIIDGGWLLHRISWPHSITYEELCKIYYKYLANNFGSNIKVVFDGYSSESITSIKSYERYRRKEKHLAPDVDIQLHCLVTMTQQKFLSNVANKYRLVELIANYFNQQGIETTIATDDADVEIVEKALQVEKEVERAVAVIGSDIDLLILLIARTRITSNIFFYKISTGKKKMELYSTSDNQNYQPYILFAHAFAGCDSTSALYKKGKRSVITLLKKNENLKQSVFIFHEKNKTVDELYPVAERIVKALYCPNVDDQTTIAQLRYNIYSKSVITGDKESALAILAPTESALKLHTKRVYYQIQLWLKNEDICPKDWGWTSSNFMLVPVMLENGISAAPDTLLKNVFCSCLGDCSTSRCSCKKAGLKCSHFCKNCNGSSCSNTLQVRIDFDDDVLNYDDIDEGIENAGEPINATIDNDDDIDVYDFVDD